MAVVPVRPDSLPAVADGRGGEAAHTAPKRPTRLGAGPIGGLAVLVLLVILALVGREIVPYDPAAISGPAYQPPSRVHLLGTNDLGQDVLSELLAGVQRSLVVGLSVAVMSTAVAWGVGLVAGFAPWGNLLMAPADLLLAIPLLPLLLLLVAYVGPGLGGLVAAMGLLIWPAFARVVRTQVLSARERDYVLAAHALGATPLRVLGRHVLPETVPIIVTKFILTARWAILIESNLAFLGLGDPGAESWGIMLSHAFRDPLLFTRGTWLWSALPPAAAIVAAVLSLGLVAQLTEAPRPSRRPSLIVRVVPRMSTRAVPASASATSRTLPGSARHVAVHPRRARDLLDTDVHGLVYAALDRGRQAHTVVEARSFDADDDEAAR